MNSLLGALGIVFITLKLIGIINWSWFFVLIPLYPALGLFLMLVVLAVYAGVQRWL